MKKPIRILHLANLNRSSGVASFLMNYYRHIDRDKVQFDFIHSNSNQPNYIEEIECLGGKVHYVPSYKHLLAYRKRLRQILGSQRYQIIHTHEAAVSILALYYAKKYRIPTRIAHSHNPMMEVKWKNLVVILLRPLFQKFSTDFWACSKESGLFLFGKRIESCLKILPNAIDTEKFQFNPKTRQEMRKNLGVENNFVIGHIGRFNVQKNHLFLIDVFNEVYKMRPNAKLLLIGNGELLDIVRHKIEKLNLEQVVLFLGIREDIPELLQCMDLFLFPSIFEGLGIALVEAQAAGLKCVASSSVPHEVQASNNIVFLDITDRIEEWVKQILVFNNYKRKNTIEQVKKSGYDIILSTQNMQKKYLELFKKGKTL